MILARTSCATRATISSAGCGSVTPTPLRSRGPGLPRRPPRVRT